MSTLMQPSAPSPQTAPAARAVNATKVYGQGDAAVRALDGISVQFAPGQFSAIMGPSGSGKSTLMHCMAGLDTITSGQVYVGAVELNSLNDKDLTRLRRDQIGFIFQSYNLVPTNTSPRVTESSPARQCMSVDFPEPEGPMIAV